MNIRKVLLVPYTLLVLLAFTVNATTENTTNHNSATINAMDDENLIQLISHPKLGKVATSEIFRRIRQNDAKKNNEMRNLVFRYWMNKEQSESMRAVCFQGLRILGNQDAVDVLSHQLTAGSSETERIRAAYQLGALGNPSVLSLLESAIAADKGVEGHGRSVADACIFAMGQIGSASASALMRLWHDTTRRQGLETAIISAIGQTREKSFVPVLIEIVEQENTFLRRSAVIALGEIGEADALPVLNKLRDEKDPQFKEHVLLAIEKIEGKQLSKPK